MQNRTRFLLKSAGAVSLLALLVFPLTAASSKAKPEEVGLSSERLTRIHTAIQHHIDAGDIAGAVTLVGRKGRLAHLEAQGVMDLASKKPMSTDTIFHLASMTKPIAGVAILMLMEEGKLRLTDPVSKYIPELKTLTVAVPMEAGPGQGPAAGRGAEPKFYRVPAAREITIRDLLTHTSGLVSGGISATEAAKMPRKPTDTLADYIPRLAAVPLAFQPGSRWTYSPGAGFDTLGRVVEVISGQTFDAFLRQRIFDPLGMKDTFFYPPDDRLPRVATIYQRTPEGLTKAPDQRVTPNKYFSGGGGLMSTAEDYLQFGQMLVNGGQLNGKRLLSPTTVELMSSIHVKDSFPGRPAGRSWGLSVQVISDPIAAAMRVSPGSFGWDGAFGTHFWVDPKEKMVGLLMVQTSNRDTDRDFENAIMQAIVE
ncbi:MAG: serine hydrolase domain-containing protein [Acidobacteriota bacterium]